MQYLTYSITTKLIFWGLEVSFSNLWLKDSRDEIDLISLFRRGMDLP